jgi:hypothetical protein
LAEGPIAFIANFDDAGARETCEEREIWIVCGWVSA